VVQDRELIVGVKQTSLRPGEIVTAVRLPVLRGGQEFLKVGSRNAMVISVVIVAVVVAVLLEFGLHGSRAAHIASAIIGHYLKVGPITATMDEG